MLERLPRFRGEPGTIAPLLERAAHIDDDGEQWTVVDREGLAFEIAESEYGPTRMRYEREGTSIALVSDLDREALARLA